MKVVVGIDPGTAACGSGIVHESEGRLRALGHGWWKTAAGKRPELRLKTIFDGVAGLIAFVAGLLAGPTALGALVILEKDAPPKQLVFLERLVSKKVSDAIT